MTAGRPGWTDERVEQLIGNLLRYGVLTAALVTAAGGILYLARHHGDPPPDLSHFNEGAPEQLRSPSGILHEVFAGSSWRRGLIQLGLLLLIATPVARVVFSVFAFQRQHDRTYVLVTLFVLVVLLFSIFVYPHLPGASPR
jgi:uncharacterized membrane protein